MKKNTMIIVVIAAAMIIISAFLIILRSPEDDWICSNGRWVAHGHPSIPKPLEPCSSNIGREAILKYQPMQCEDTPWEEAYKNGVIKFFKEPTEKEMASAYYSSLGVILTNFEDIQTDKIVCSACSVCPRADYYTATIDESGLDKMVADGWKKV